MNKKLKKRLKKIIIGAVVFAVAILLSHMLPILGNYYIDLVLFGPCQSCDCWSRHSFAPAYSVHFRKWGKDNACPSLHTISYPIFLRRSNK